MRDYSIEELEELTGFARRTIRYYIQKGLVDAPFGARKTPSYTHKHAEQLLQIKKFKAQGLNLTRIAQLLCPESNAAKTSLTYDIGEISTVSKVKLADGVTLEIDHARNNLTSDELRELANIVLNHINKSQGE